MSTDPDPRHTFRGFIRNVILYLSVNIVIVAVVFFTDSFIFVFQLLITVGSNSNI